MKLLERLRQLLEPSTPDYDLRVTDLAVTLVEKNGATCWIEWSDLQEVSLLAVCYGRVEPCILWNLKGSQQAMAFPDDAKGYREAFNIMCDLPGFSSMLYSHAREGRYKEPVIVWKKENRS